MLAKTITYTDYEGEERTETFYFNITKAELTKLQFKYPGGYSNRLERILAAKDAVALMKEFEDLIDLSYGSKSDDGRRFIKSEELTEAFKQTEAYSELFTQLLTDPEAASAFVNGIMPKVDLTEEQQAELNSKMKNLIDAKASE